MGFFGGEEVYVASTVYNLAGDITERANFLKGLVTANIITNSRYSAADVIRSGYLRSPGLNMRKFFNWALDSEYDRWVGVPVGGLGGRAIINQQKVAAQIPRGRNEGINFYKLETKKGVYTYWAEQWVLQNHPTIYGLGWTSTYNAAANTITVYYGSSTLGSFVPADFSTSSTYIYAMYTRVNHTTIGPWAYGEWVNADPLAQDFDSYVAILEESVDTSDDVSWSYTNVYEKVSYVGIGSDGVAYSIKTRLTVDFYYHLYDGIYRYRTKIDTQRLTGVSESNPIYWIYKNGSGNDVLDTAIWASQLEGEFLPIIPVMLDNVFVPDHPAPNVYTYSKKAFKKVTGQRYDDLVSKMKENPDIGDIDYAYIVHGVPLNTKENAGKEYIYRFFKRAWLAELGLLPEADGANQDSQPGFNVYVSTNRDPVVYDVGVHFEDASEVVGTGLVRDGAKTGDLWIELNPDPVGYWVATDPVSYLDTISVNRTSFTISWQDGPSTWRKLTIISAFHHNNVYRDKAVLISARSALEDLEESGFLVPLHYATLDEMSLIQSTQLMTTCVYLVLNSYVIVKKKWYQTGFFKFILFAAIVTLTIVFPPFGAEGAAILTSIGTAIGLSGTLALIAGAIVYTIASSLIMQILGKVSVAIFGEKWGALIASITTFVGMAVGGNLLAGGNLSTAWSGLMSAQGLIGLTSAVGTGIAGYVEASAREVMGKITDLQASYEKQAAEAANTYAQIVGYDKGMLDPMSLTDTSFGNALETPGQFLARTLMTGSDIAEISLGMISEFTTATLTPALPASI